MIQFFKNIQFLFQKYSFLIAFCILINSCITSSNTNDLEGELIDVYLKDIHSIESSEFMHTEVLIINNQHCNSCTLESITQLKSNLNNKSELIVIFSKKDLNYLESNFSDINIKTILYDSRNMEKYGLSKMYPFKFIFKDGELISKKRYTGVE